MQPGTNDPNQTLSYAQSRNYWYHWFFATPRGRKALETDRDGLCRFLWQTWSTRGKERFFTRGYDYRLIKAGHFIQRDNPTSVVQAARELLSGAD